MCVIYKSALDLLCIIMDENLKKLLAMARLGNMNVIYIPWYEFGSTSICPCCYFSFNDMVVKGSDGVSSSVAVTLAGI